MLAQQAPQAIAPPQHGCHPGWTLDEGLKEPHPTQLSRAGNGLGEEAAHSAACAGKCGVQHQDSVECAQSELVGVWNRSGDSWAGIVLWLPFLRSEHNGCQRTHVLLFGRQEVVGKPMDCLDG